MYVSHTPHLARCVCMCVYVCGCVYVCVCVVSSDDEMLRRDSSRQCNGCWLHGQFPIATAQSQADLDNAGWHSTNRHTHTTHTRTSAKCFGCYAFVVSNFPPPVDKS